MVVMSLIYQRVTPYDDLAQIRDNNIAAALPLAGVLLAVGIVVEAAIGGEVVNWGEDLASVGIYLAVSLVLLLVLRVLADLFLLPGASLSKEVAEDRNTGAGLVEGTSFVVGALLLAFFLT
jgi:putative membrane protein